MKQGRIQAIRGMPDVLPSSTPAWQHLEAEWRQLIARYGYAEIRFPILEATQLFKRSIGEATDIVEKEMFTMLDRDEASLTMRPEGTACCVRACLEHGLLHNQIQRLWYMGPMFRYERPQKGRYRQFYQIGVETFGLAGPDIELEHILLIARFWRLLGIEAGITLEINSLGSTQARQAYRASLVAYFKEHLQQLDEDSQRRLSTNPLRILDSKNPAMQDLIQGAPKLFEHLDEDSSTQFEYLKRQLSALNINYKVNPCLVRGLDYYNGIVYEWVTDQLGAQGTLCAGGRFDGLVSDLGGEPMPAVGFAIGLERVLLLQAEMSQTTHTQNLDAYIIMVGEKAENVGLGLSEQLRTLCPTLSFLSHCGGGSFKSQFKKADKSGARFALILGDAEIDTQTIGVKNLRENIPQQNVPLTDVQAILTM